MPERKFTCSWPGCGSLFTKKFSLIRHIGRVHKKERTHMCREPKCGAAFSTAFDLKRHELCVHVKDRSYKCNQCCKTFTAHRQLRTHERRIHGTWIKTEDNTSSILIEKPAAYECAECGQCCTRKDNLIKHIISKHDKEKEHFECHTCDCEFRYKLSLKKHIFSKHPELVGRTFTKERFAKHHEPVERTPTKESQLCCVICKKSFPYSYQVEKHYQEFHEIDLNTEKHVFPNEQEFLNWKRSVEDATKTQFRLRRKLQWKHTFVCHRSGPLRVKTEDRKRAPFKRGSKKLDGVCPAAIILHLNRKDSSCVAIFTSTHVGHMANDESELKYCFGRPEDRNKIVDDQSAVGRADLPNDLVSEECEDVSRNDLLPNEDLCNVESIYIVKSQENFIRPRKDDEKNEDAFAQMYDECILLYKRKDQKITIEFEGMKYEV